MGKDIHPKECMDKGLNGACVQSPLAFCQACWEPSALKWVSCSLAAFERVISWPTLAPGRQFSALCLAQTTLLFLKTGQSCCLTSFLHITPLAFLAYICNFYASYLYQQFSVSSLLSCNLLKTQWHKLTKLHIRRILTAETSFPHG